MANVPTSNNPARPRRTPTGAGLAEYLRGVREELRKATWPTRAELIRLTQVVLVVIAIVALYVGTLDAVLTWITTGLLNFQR
jgi:preprotein translocase SecE subunit